VSEAERAAWGDDDDFEGTPQSPEVERLRTVIAALIEEAP